MAKLYIKNTDGTFAPHSSIAVTNLDIVQGKGDSLTSAMSQKSVTEALKGKQSILTDTDGSYGQRVADLEKTKQDTLIAGDNITIVGNVISSTGGDGGGGIYPSDMNSDFNDDFAN